MPKVSAEQTPVESIIRVDITAETLNEKNPDGSWKFSDDQLREWVTKLRGDREVTIAKKASKEAGAAKKAAVADEQDEEMTDDE